MKILNNLFWLLIFLFFFSFYLLQSQILTPVYFDSSLKSNTYNSYFDKQLNSLQFVNSLNYRCNLLSGDFMVQHLYSGNVILGAENSFLDDENFSLNYIKLLNDSFSFLFESNFQLSSDSKNIGINEAERANLNFGVIFSIENLIKLSTSFGIERNKQQDILSNGVRFKGSFALNDTKLENFILNSQNSFESVKLNSMRVYSDLLLGATLTGKFDDNNLLQLNLQYKNISRDFISYPFISEDFFEKRLGKRILPSLKIIFSPFSKITTNLVADISFYTLSKSFSKLNIDNNYSALQRIFSERQLSFNINFAYNERLFQQLVVISYNYRDEINQVSKIYPTNEVTFNSIEQFESQKNNYQNRLNLFVNSRFVLSQKDTIGLFGEVGIQRYDTPSKQNVDDRDELNTLIMVVNDLRFSKYFRLRSMVEYNGYHLVFLNSKRSILNNWEHILKLYFSGIYQTEFFLLSPSFEVLSSYTIYDFENKSFSIQNYLFRQFQLKDSNYVFISKKYTFESQISLRFLERGILYWNNFEMVKDTKIDEIFVRMLLFTKLIKQVSLGIGSRIYNIIQIPYKPSSVNKEYKFYSFSPETEIRVFIDPNKSIFLQGWFELKFLNHRIISTIPNLILKINYKL